MDGHPIKTYIDQLFPTKPVDKRNAWTQYLIDQEYDTVEDLKGIQDDAWKNMASGIPNKVAEDIKKSFKTAAPAAPTPVSEHVKKQEIPANSTLTEQLNKNQNQIPSIEIKKIQEIQVKDQPKAQISQINSKKDISKIEQVEEKKIQITQEDIALIGEYLNLEIPHQKIIKLMGAPLGSPKAEAIMQRIRMLIRPPKPFPQNCNRIQFRKKDSLPMFHYMGREDPMRKYYTFLVVGQTGSGKTTLLDAFVNKLLGIQYTDNWRYQLVDESKFNHLAGGASKTSEITTYFINDINNKFNVKIIDSPGFGDTKGTKVDDQITNKFEQLFKQISQIDYILLTIKSTETRLKPGSKYVYDRVQQLFGKDSRDRFILMCTFADGKVPLCLEDNAIGKDVCYEKYFTFNNSALYTPSDKGDTTTKFFWKMAMSSIETFTEYVINSNRTPLSLTLSSQVLETRKYLCQSIKTSQQSLSLSWKQLESTKKIFAAIKDNKKKIQQNGSFEYYQTRYRTNTILLGNTYQMCQDCQTTCCQICVWPPNSTYSTCSYFSRGNCPCCAGKCPRQRHIRADKQVTKTPYQEKIVVDCKKKAHEQGLSGVSLYTTLLKEQVQKISKLVQKIWDLTLDIKANLKKLQQKALKPKLFTDKEFYDQMIIQEEEKREYGWTDRVDSLRLIIKKIDALESIQKSMNIKDLFPDLENLQKTYVEVIGSNPTESTSKCSIF